jgi:hydroxymethylbilane synthase
MLEREDPRDGFVSPRASNLAGLAAGAVVGTASLRRRAQVLHRRPDLSVVLFRGNVNTRMRKLGEGQADATLLAVAGLRRLGMDDALTSIMEPGEMLPAVGQGAIGIACRAGDGRALALLEPLNHLATLHRVTAERALLEVLDGSCRTPIAALASLAEDGTLALTGLVARPDGSEVLTAERRGPVADARAIGIDAGEELRRRAGPGFMDALE